MNVLKCGLRKSVAEAMDEIAENLEDAERRHNKISYWYVKKLEGNSQSGLIPVKDRNRASISGKESVKDRWVTMKE